MNNALSHVLVAIVAIAISCATQRTNKSPLFIKTSDNGNTQNLTEKYWRLIELNGTIIDSLQGEREPHIVFRESDHRINGSGGCNQFSGTYKIVDLQLSISEVIATKMACEGVNYESDFLNSLESAEQYFTSGDSLFLLINGCISMKFINKSSRE